MRWPGSIAVAECLIIQFAKAPSQGQVKTRLQPALSATQSLQLHQALVEYTLNNLRQTPQVDVELWGSDDHPWLCELAANHTVPFAVQQGADLGERMQHAMHAGLERYRKVILIGSDCPAIDAAYLTSAMAALDNTPVVIGAAADGGYVLIGAVQANLPVFDAMSWGSGGVLAETGRRLAAHDIAYTVLPPQHDIDRPDDLVHLPPALQAWLSESSS